MLDRRGFAKLVLGLPFLSKFGAGRRGTLARVVGISTPMREYTPNLEGVTLASPATGAPLFEMPLPPLNSPEESAKDDPLFEMPPPPNSTEGSVNDLADAMGRFNDSAGDLATALTEASTPPGIKTRARGLVGAPEAAEWLDYRRRAEETYRRNQDRIAAAAANVQLYVAGACDSIGFVAPAEPDAPDSTIGPLWVDHYGKGVDPRRA